MTWQPIETAPKDETPVLLWCPQSWDTRGVRVGFWSEQYEDWFDSDAASISIFAIYSIITHWMPLPPPPTE